MPLFGRKKDVASPAPRKASAPSGRKVPAPGTRDQPVPGAPSGRKSGAAPVAKGKTSASSGGGTSRSAAPNRTGTKKGAAPKRAAPAKPAARRAAPKRGSGARPGARAAPARPDAHPFDPAEGRVHVLDLPWELREFARQSGARWDPVVGAFVCPDPPPSALTPFASRPYSWERWREDDLNGHVLPVSPDGDGTMVARPHQREASDAIVAAHDAGRPGHLLADDVGVGKTVSSLQGLLSLPDTRTLLVVCPLGVIAHWRHTLAAVGDRDVRAVVINYDRVKRLLDVPAKAAAATKARTRNKHIAESGRPLVRFDAAIIDESHYCRNPVSQRTRAVDRLTESAFRVWSSATAGQNPLELTYLKPLLAAVTGSSATDLAAFEDWCTGQGIGVRKGAYGRWEWDEDPADIATMNRILFAPPPAGGPPAGLRRVPEQVRGWEPLTRHAVPVELDPSSRHDYEDLWTSFREQRGLARQGGDPKGGFATTLRFRQKASLLRVPTTVAYIEELIANGRQVHVAVEFLETLDAVVGAVEQGGVSCSTMHGGIVADDREAERVAFQRGDTQVMVSTIKEGVSLNAGEGACGGNDVPRVTVVHDARWSGIDALQVEGRCHRDGRFAPAHYLYAEDTTEAKVIARCVEKMSNAKGMLGDDTDELERLLTG